MPAGPPGAVCRRDVIPRLRARCGAPKAKEAGPRAARAKRQLGLKQLLAVRLKVKGLEVTGTVETDGTLKVKGTTYPSPHAAANEIAGKLVNCRIDGFQAWRYQDEQGKWHMLRDHVA